MENQLVLLRLGTGVDLFFIISGFIMVFASQRTPQGSNHARDFYIRRIIRIAPLYWALTPLTVWLESKHPSASEVVASYLFIPYQQPSGAISPLLSVGWTLNFEMFFYALFAVGLWVGRPVLVAATAIVGLVAIGLLIDHSSVALRFWSDPIMFEFVAGMLLGKAFIAGYRIPLWASALAIVTAACLFAFPYAPSYIAPLPHTRWRVLVSGLPMLLLFGGILMADVRLALPGMVARAIVSLGDASYALYLLHIPVLLTCYLLWNRGWGPPAITSVAMLAATGFCLSIAIAVGVNRAMEAPLGAWLRRGLLTAKPSLEG